MFEFPKKGGFETCHFCDKRVYVVERMTAEGKFFHRNCFRCEYCNTSLRLGISLAAFFSLLPWNYYDG